MSRIGRKPIGIPSGVAVSVSGATVTVKGPKGEMSFTYLPDVKVVVQDNAVVVERTSDLDRARAQHGLVRALVGNMVKGVSDGYEKKLEIIGVGFKAQIKKDILNLQLGFSHPVDYVIPKGITITQDEKNKNLITVHGVDKQLVGQVAADIRTLRPPEPYKGKGIRYIDEFVRRKVGKAAVTKSAA
jgi:large subunit ribosomal protein L6